MLPVDYIVRIYRYEKNNPNKLVGTVEKVGIEVKKAFVNLDELWKIINSSTSTNSDMSLYLLKNTDNDSQNHA